MMKQLTFHTKKGIEIAEVLEDLAQLRIEVFRVYPYLYEGSLRYEKKYLQTYINSAKSMLFAVYDGQKMVGASTCIPLSDETFEVQEPFLKANIDLQTVFYFGESILLPQYRGLGIGHRFFEEREAHAKSFKTYTHTYFCAVQRPENHPLKPNNYQALDEFWTKRGYIKQVNLQSQFGWLDIGNEEETLKPMIYWSKTI